MNVGPTSLDTFDRALSRPSARHSAAIYGCTQSEFSAPQDCRLTQNGRKLCVHVFAWPFKYLHLPSLGGKVEYARFLHDGSEVLITGSKWEIRQLTLQPEEQLLFLPVEKPDVIAPLIELTLK